MAFLMNYSLLSGLAEGHHPLSTIQRHITTTQRHLLLGRVLVKELYCVRRGHRHDLYQTVAIAIYV